MRTTMLLADVADRDPRAQWLERGGLDTQARALKRVKEILTRDNPAVFSPEMDAKIRLAFPGIVAGEALPPEGWKRIARSEDEEETGGIRRRRRLHLRAAEEA